MPTIAIEGFISDSERIRGRRRLLLAQLICLGLQFRRLLNGFF